MLFFITGKRTCYAVSRKASHLYDNSFECLKESIYSFSKPCIFFDFSTIHALLNFLMFICCFRCPYFGNPLKDARFTLILIQIVGKFLAHKGNSALDALFLIKATFGFKFCRKSEHFCFFFVEFKISKDIWRWFLH